MNSTDYRRRAEELLNSKPPMELYPRVIEQAAVWAQLATAAAISETATAKETDQ